MHIVYIVPPHILADMSLTLAWHFPEVGNPWCDLDQRLYKFPDEKARARIVVKVDGDTKGINETPKLAFLHCIEIGP